MPLEKSWSDDIVLFGDEASGCIELFWGERKRVVEISVRIDLRYEYKRVLSAICALGQNKKCLFLNSDLKILKPEILIIETDIKNNSNLGCFNKLND